MNVVYEAALALCVIGSEGCFNFFRPVQDVMHSIMHLQHESSWCKKNPQINVIWFFLKTYVESFLFFILSLKALRSLQNFWYVDRKFHMYSLGPKKNTNSRFSRSQIISSFIKYIQNSIDIYATNMYHLDYSYNIFSY